MLCRYHQICNWVRCIYCSSLVMGPYFFNWRWAPIRPCVESASNVQPFWKIRLDKLELIVRVSSTLFRFISFFSINFLWILFYFFLSNESGCVAERLEGVLFMSWIPWRHNPCIILLSVYKMSMLYPINLKNIPKWWLTTRLKIYIYIYI